MLSAHPRADNVVHWRTRADKAPVFPEDTESGTTDGYQERMIPCGATPTTDTSISC